MLGSGRDSRFMSFVGFLSISGLALAVAVLVTVLSVINGFERELLQRVLAVLPQGGLYAQEPDFDWQKLRREVLLHPKVEGASPSAEAAGLALHAEQLVGVQVRGIDIELESSVTDLPTFFSAEGMAELETTKFGVAIGSELAASLKATKGDFVTLVLPNVTYSLAGPSMATRRLKVVTIFQVGADLDRNLMLLRIQDLAKLKRQTHVDSLTLRFVDLFEAPKILYQLSLSSSQNVYGVSWMRQNGNLYDAIQTQKATMFLLLLVLVAVAAFNLVSNLTMVVEDSQSEIAIIKTMGASYGDMLLIFLAHGIMVCMVGLSFGLLVGIAVTSSLSAIYSIFTNTLGLDPMSEYFIRYLPTDIRADDIGMIGLLSLIICSFATIYPALKAASAEPAEILSRER